MNIVIGCIINNHDLRLVAVAAALCILACATAFAMNLRARAARGRMRAVWLVTAGMVAGAGIWATHFVSMLAFNAGLPVGFDIGLTVLSVLIAMVLCAAGFALAIRRRRGAAGGMVVGAAISAMHYVGMAAIEVPGETHWNTNLVIASVIIGVSLSGLAGHLATARRGRVTRVASVATLVLAIVGLHFTGMAAVTFLPDNTQDMPDAVLAPTALAMIVGASTAFLVLQALVVAMVDQYLANRARGEALRMRNHIAELEATKARLEQTSGDLTVALEMAEAANKAKSAFFASMSHELRTPLNAVIGFSDTMLTETFGPIGSPRYREYLEDIHNSGAHLLAVINDILDISRFDAGHGELHEEECSPAGEIEDALRMVVPQAEKAQITLVTEIATGLPRLKADRRRLCQILLNLLSNAVKFTPPGGTVRVKAEIGEQGLVIAVADNGIGIAPEDMAKALEPFGQVDSSLARKYAGTGLGLPLTRQLVELHGGAMTLESAPHEGTTVTVTLPAWRLIPLENHSAAA